MDNFFFILQILQLNLPLSLIFKSSLIFNPSFFIISIALSLCIHSSDFLSREYYMESAVLLRESMLINGI